MADTVIFLTVTNAANQTWNVPSDWDSVNNFVEVISHGASGGGGVDVGQGYFGGGSGGYAKKAAISLTPGGTATYRLRDRNSGSGTAAACWFNGTTLALSSVGIQGAGGQTGAVTTSGIGTTLRAGANGGNGFLDANGDGGGGAGAAGLTGVGGAGSDATGAFTGGGAGGTADGGTVAASTAGTEWTSNPGGLQKGSGGGGTGGGAGTGSAGSDGALYGSGGGGGAAGAPTAGGLGQQGLIIITYTPVQPALAGQILM